MLQGILSMFHIENTSQLRELLQNFGHFLPAEQLELINAVVNEIDKGDDMNREALAQAADYLSAGAQTAEASLQENLPQAEVAINTAASQMENHSTPEQEVLYAEIVEENGDMQEY